MMPDRNRPQFPIYLTTLRRRWAALVFAVLAILAVEQTQVDRGSILGE